jgi:hypothetical protein
LFSDFPNRLFGFEPCNKKGALFHCITGAPLASCPVKASRVPPGFAIA